MSERAAVNTAPGGDATEERPLADAHLVALRRLAPLRGGRCRADKIYGADDGVLQDLVGWGLITELETRPMLVRRFHEGGPHVGDVTVFEITDEGRRVYRESCR